MEKVRGIVATLFNAPLSRINAESSPATLDGWDSMGQLTLILEIEQEFGIAMTHERVQRMQNVGAIADIITEAAV